MSTRISVTSARLDDPKGMAEFLLPIPNRDVLAKVLQKQGPVSSRAYDDETGTARFVVSDGHEVECFVVTDITIDQAEMIAAASMEKTVWSEPAFRAAVQQALGPTFDPAE